MESVDLEKLQVAIKYIERMADGKNPVNNLPVDNDTVINDPNVIRCLYFVSDVLKQIHSNGGSLSGRKDKKEAFPFEILKDYQYKNDKTISQFFKQINEPIEGKNIKKLSYMPVRSWLINSGYLIEIQDSDTGKKRVVLTEKGKALGIYSEMRKTMYGNEYLAIVYNAQAQMFIVNNIVAIMSGEVLD